MDTIVTRAPQSPRRSWRTVAAAVAIGIAVLVAFTAVDGLVRGPATIDQVRVENRTDDLIEVLIRTDDGSFLPVTLVDPRSRADAQNVVDQGDDWTFVVRVSDRTVDRIHLTRAELARADWTVTVPAPG